MEGEVDAVLAAAALPRARRNMSSIAFESGDGSSSSLKKRTSRISKGFIGGRVGSDTCALTTTVTA